MIYGCNNMKRRKFWNLKDKVLHYPTKVSVHQLYVHNDEESILYSFQPKSKETDDSVVFASMDTGEGINLLVQNSVSVSTSYNPSFRGLHVEELDASESEGVCKACLLDERSQEEEGGPPTGLVKKPPKHSCAKKFFDTEFTGTYSSLQATGNVDRGRAWEVVDTNGVFWNRQLRVKRSISYDHMPFPVEKDEKNENFDVSVIFRHKFICMEFLFWYYHLYMCMHILYKIYWINDFFLVQCKFIHSNGTM